MAAAAAQEQSSMNPSVLDDIKRRLTEVWSVRPGKQVQLSETDIEQLYVASRDISLQQPNSLKIEEPIKICDLIFISPPEMVETEDHWL